MSDTVLIVDDDDLNREVMEAFLSLVGYDVLITGSGLKALDITRSTLPDLLILDMRLPDLDGIAVCRKLKSDPLTSAIPIMMITGLSDSTIRQRALAAGVDLFFPRPFEGDDFVVEVQRLLKEHS